MSDKSFKEFFGDAAVRIGFAEKQPVINKTAPSLKEFTSLAEAQQIGVATIQTIETAVQNIDSARSEYAKGNAIPIPQRAFEAYRIELEANREAA